LRNLATPCNLRKSFFSRCCTKSHLVASFLALIGTKNPAFCQRQSAAASRLSRNRFLCNGPPTFGAGCEPRHRPALPAVVWAIRSCGLGVEFHLPNKQAPSQRVARPGGVGFALSTWPIRNELARSGSWLPRQVAPEGKSTQCLACLFPLGQSKSFVNLAVGCSWREKPSPYVARKPT